MANVGEDVVDAIFIIYYVLVICYYFFLYHETIMSVHMYGSKKRSMIRLAELNKTELA